MESKTTAAGVVPARDLQREDVQPQSAESRSSEDNQQESIANLAHALWQQRGCPIGSPEQDWIEAEQQLRRPEARSAGVGR